MFALGDDQVGAILATRSGAAEPRLRRPPPRTPGAVVAPPASPVAAQVVRPAALRVTGSAARALARNGVRLLPAAIREDARAILIHGRQIVRTAIHRRPAAPPEPVHRRVAEPSVPPVPAREPVAKAALLSTFKAVVHPREGDVLWTAGVSDASAPLRRIAEMDRYRGMRIAAVFHGVIPSQDPEFGLSGRAAAVFEAAAIDLLRCASLVVTVSDWSRGALLRFAGEAGLAPPPIAVIRPGARVAGAHHDGGDRPGPLAELIGTRRFALAVGPVATRSNLGLLVRIWETLVAQTAFDLDLLIVGPPARDDEDAARAVEELPLFGSRITWIEACPDDMLSSLYAASEAVLCPSFIDGWGLSVTEALAHGRPVVASARGAYAEAALATATLLDPQDLRAWTDAVLTIAAGPRRCVEPLAAPGWDGCAAAVAQSLLALMSPSRGR